MLTKWLDANGFWTHWQNLNERPRAKNPEAPFMAGPTGWPYHGRCWVHARPTSLIGDARFGLSWNLWTHFCHLGVDVHQSADDDFCFSIALPPIALWWSVSSSWTRRLAKWLISLEKSDMGCNYSGRELQVAIHNNALWWDLWVDDSGWTHTRPKWRDGSWHPLDTFLGKTKHSERVLEERDVMVHMPEGAYEGHVRLLESSWERPRWFAKRMQTADIKMRQPIPHPGKGENSYDCGEDATYGLSCPAKSIPDAVSKIIGTVLESRERYGGQGWKPENGPHAGATS